VAVNAPETVLSKEEISKLMERGYEDPAWWLRTFLPEWFPLEQPPIHLGLIAVLTRRCAWLDRLDEDGERVYSERAVDWIIENFSYRVNPQDEESTRINIFFRDERGFLCMRLSRFTLVEMPRGISKTTIVNGVECWEIVYGESGFLVYVSEAGHHAQAQLSSVTGQLSSNPMIRAVYGDLRPQQRGMDEDGKQRKWSESQGIVVTLTDQIIAARGRGGQVRGLNIDGRRPRRIVLDDVEDLESVKTEEQRKKTRDWFWSDVVPALPELDPDATIVVLATLRAADALPTRLEMDQEWTTVKFGVMDRKGNPVWPQWMNDEKIEKRKQGYAARGQLHIWYLEYENTVRSPEDAKFRPEYISVEPINLSTIIARAMAIDPAISVRKGASASAICVCGITVQGLLVFCEFWGKVGASPREQIDNYFQLHYKWLPDPSIGSLTHGVESIAYQSALIHFMREEMFRQAKVKGPDAYFEIIPVTHSRHDLNKEERIEGILQPRYAAGVVRHLMHFPAYETALLDWPNSKLDYPDAAAMAVSLLDNFAGLASAEDEFGKDEYPPLSKVMGGEWRTH